MLRATHLTGFGLARSAVSKEFKALLTTSANLSTYTHSGYGLTNADAGKLAVALVYNFNGAGGALPSSVTIGGAAATKIIGAVPPASYDVVVSLWTATVPSSPSDDVVIVSGAGQTGSGAALYVLGNLNATPHDSEQSNDSTAALATTGVDTAADGVTIIGNIQRANGSESGTTFSGGIAVDDELNIDGGFGLCVAGSRSSDVQATGTSITTTLPSSDLTHQVVATFAPTL